jgi:hypothetical protein
MVFIQKISGGKINIPGRFPRLLFKLFFLPRAAWQMDEKKYAGI